jgi:integrase
LQAFLDNLTRTSTYIATKHNGQPWKNEEQLQKAVSNWLSALEAKGIVGEGLTLHGLRVTYAAALKRGRANTSNVAAALGDRDERMGAHYTRHVENEARVIQAFGKPKKKKRTVLENGKA